MKRVLRFFLCLAVLFAVLLSLAFGKGTVSGESEVIAASFPEGVTGAAYETSCEQVKLVFHNIREAPDERVYTYLNDVYECRIEKKGADGKWMTLRASNFPLSRMDKPSVTLEEETEIVVNWKKRYGKLDSGQYRLIFSIYLQTGVGETKTKLVEILFEVGP